jgi:hypothetical protein
MDFIKNDELNLLQYLRTKANDKVELLWRDYEYVCCAKQKVLKLVSFIGADYG